MFSSIIMYQSRICFQMDYCMLRHLIPLTTQLQLNICKGHTSVFSLPWGIAAIFFLFMWHWQCVFINLQKCAFWQEKSPGIQLLIFDSPSHGYWRDDSARRQGGQWQWQQGLITIFCAGLAQKYPMKIYVGSRLGLWLLPIEHRKNWKPVDVIFSNTAEQSTPKNTSLAAGFVRILLLPALKPLLISPWSLDFRPCTAYII